MTGCNFRERFAPSFSVFDSRCSPLHLLPHSRVSLFRHRQRPTPEMDLLPTCFDRRAPSCGRTSVMAIERRRFLNASAPFSTAPLVLGLSVIRALNRTVRLPLMRGLIRHSTRTVCV